MENEEYRTHLIPETEDSLNSLREKIDAQIDPQILNGLIARLKTCEEIAEIKKKMGMPITCNNREKLVLERWQNAMVRAGYDDPKGIKKIYRAIRDLCKSTQRKYQDKLKSVV